MSTRHPQSDSDGRMMSCIIRAVAYFYGVAEVAVTGRNQSKHVTHARHVAMYFCAEMQAGNYDQIGQRFSGRGPKAISLPVCRMRREVQAYKARHGHESFAWVREDALRMFAALEVQS